MNISIRANVLTSIILLMIMMISFFFLPKDNWINQEKLSFYYYEKYVKDRMLILDKLSQDENWQCQQQKESEISFSLNIIHYQYSCRQSTIFVTQQNVKKYQEYDEIDQIFDLENFKDQIYYIHSFDELPESSIDEPKFVVAMNDISGELDTNFYGILVTKNRLEFSKGNIIGAVYSHYHNDHLKRFHKLKKDNNVIERLREIYTKWEFIPYSRNIL